MIDRDSSWYWLDYVARYAAPLLITIGLVLVSQVPLRLPGIAPVTIGFSLIAVFYWALHQHEMLPAVAVFFIGLLQDMLVGTPLGLSAFSLLLPMGLLFLSGVFLSKVLSRGLVRVFNNSDFVRGVALGIGIFH